MKRRIRNATVMTPDGARDVDLIVDGSTISHVDPPEGVGVDEEIDASGLTILPGVIDDQVHFREPGLTHKEDLYTASRACAAGGVTTFLEMPNTIPNATSQARIEEKLALAAHKSIVNYGFYIGATPENIRELKHAHRVPGIKIFVGSSTGDLLVDQQKDLETIFGEATLPICVHSEDEDTIRANKQRIGTPSSVADHSRIRDHEAARVSTERLIDLAQRHKQRLHVLHVSTADEIPLLAEAGDYVTSEACPHHLFLNVDDYDRLGTLVQMNPSIKNRQDNDALWQALRDGIIDIVATDHAPHLLSEKSRAYPQSPSGMPGVQTMLPLMLDAVANDRCTLEDVVQWLCERPAKIWDIVNKGRIEEGYDADLVFVDLERTHEVRDEEQESRCGWSAFTGTSLKGWPVRTWVMGHEVYRDGVIDDSQRGSEAKYDHSRGGLHGV